MSSRTLNENKALAWYCQTNNLKPQLSTHPTYYFIAANGKEITRDINNIKREWNDMREQEQRAKARPRATSRGGRYVR